MHVEQRTPAQVLDQAVDQTLRSVRARDGSSALERTEGGRRHEAFEPDPGPERGPRPGEEGALQESPSQHGSMVGPGRAH